MYNYNELKSICMRRLAKYNGIDPECFPLKPHSPDEIMGELLQNGETVFSSDDHDVTCFRIASEYEKALGFGKILAFSKYNSDTDDYAISGYELEQ